MNCEGYLDRRADVPAHPGDGAVRVTRMCATDVDAHTEQLQDWSLHYDQLDCGSFEGSFTDVRLPGMQLFVESTSRMVRQRGRLLPHSLGIGMMIAGDGQACVNGMRTGTDTLLACDAAELDMCTPANCTLAGLVFDKSLLLDAARHRPAFDSLPAPGALLALRPPPAVLAPLRSLLMASVDLATSRPWMLWDAQVQRRIRDDLLGCLLDAIVGARQAHQVHGAGRCKHVVDRACELMMSHPDDPLPLDVVCHRIGASPRKLSYCFHDALGISPVRYVKAMRLNAVRRELRHCDAGASVYDVAARWGFWHFGHFSADYKKQFSELPSHTLRRARAGG